MHSFAAPPANYGSVEQSATPPTGIVDEHLVDEQTIGSGSNELLP
jgi:hypothetical protein